MNNLYSILANNPANLLIAGNDEHGLLPQPTAGKRTPIMPYVNRSFYENEFNQAAKDYFLAACKRCGFRTLNVKPEQTDVTLGERARRVNNARANALVTFAYNAYGDGRTFNNARGLEVFYSTYSPVSGQSRILAQRVYNNLLANTPRVGRGVKTLNAYLLYAVNCPSIIIESGFMTNFLEAKQMLDPDFQQLVGENACKGVCEYFDVTYVAPTPRSLRNNLKQGMRGDDVRYLQQKLYSKLYPEVGNIDGIFGAKTAQAVKNFQRDNGLVVDGIVGRATWPLIKDLNTGRSQP